MSFTSWGPALDAEVAYRTQGLHDAAARRRGQQSVAIAPRRPWRRRAERTATAPVAAGRPRPVVAR